MQGSAGANAFFGRQDARRMAAEQHEQETQKRANELNQTANDQLFDGYQAAGIIDATDPTKFNVDALRTQIDQGDKQAIGIILNAATASGRLPEGSKATKAVPLPSGGYAIHVVNADGSEGAITTDGTSNPNSTVVEFDAGRLANLASQNYRTSVLSNTSRFDPGNFRAQSARVDADAKGEDLQSRLAAAENRLNVFGNEAMLIAGVQEKYGEEVSRGLMDLLAETPEENREEVIETAVSDLIPENAQQLLPTVSTDTSADDSEASDDSDITAPSPALSRARIALAKQQEIGDRGALSGGTSYIESAERRVAYLENIDSGMPKEEARKKADADIDAKYGKEPKTQLARPVGRGQRKFGRNETITHSDSAAPEVKKQADEIAEETADLSGAEIAESVAKGELTVTPELTSEVRRILEAREDIQELQDLIRLNNKERAMARAVIIASSPDAATRESMSKAIDNILETGSPSMSRQDQITNRQNDESLGIRQGQLEVSIGNLERNLRGDASTRRAAITTFKQDTSNAFFGEDGTESNFDADTVRAYTNSVFVPRVNSLIANAASASELQEVYGALNMGVSLSIASLAAEEEGGVQETLLSFFRPDVEDEVDGGDFDLSRVSIEYERVEREVDGRTVVEEIPKRFLYKSAKGNQVDESVSASDLQKVSPAIFDTLMAAARRNDNLLTQTRAQ